MRPFLGGRGIMARFGSPALLGATRWPPQRQNRPTTMPARLVLLGHNALIVTLAKGFADARGSAVCRGFAVGRTVFQQPSTQWFAGAIDDRALIGAIRANFEMLIDAWRTARKSA